jgi:hypothetical protein
MDSDEITEIDDPTDAAWIVEQRNRVLEYLASQKVQHAGVSLEPRWFLSPYVAVWAVRSNTHADRIGWWAISGDVPTDYMTCTTERSASDVLLSFSRQWKTLAAEMAVGKRLPRYHIGPAGSEKEFAEMLLTRAELLVDFANDM